jgi:enoyl-CoA hydratase
LPRLVGEGRALELIMTGRRVEADECLRIGLCEKVVPEGQARQAAEEMALAISQFPQLSLRANLRMVYLQHGLAERVALEKEWYNCTGVFKAESAADVARFAKGAGRHGDFGDSALAN